MPKAIRASRSRSIHLDQQHEPSTTRLTRSRQQPYATPPASTKAKSARTRRQLKFAFLLRSQDVVEADPNRHLPLFQLPREVLLQIASSLPLLNLICLTLTCKEATSLIGTASWAQSKKEPWSLDRVEFEDLFKRDWGDVLDFCERCDTFHPPLGPPSQHRETKLTKRCFGQDAVVDYLPQDAEHGYVPVFAHIAAALAESASHGSGLGPLLASLAGDYTIARNDVLWRLQSSAQRMRGNLVLKHIHTFRHRDARESLRASHVLSAPLRLCPHQSTTKVVPERSRYIKGTELNGALLTHAITSSFPGAVVAHSRGESFKRLTPSEETQIARAAARENDFWRCRSCPTKYRVEHTQDRLTVTSWHCFGRDMLHAAKYWKWFVRRTGTMLGPDKRNDEWWSLSRTVPDFMCEM